MALGVVDLLEAVEVEEHEREPAAVAPRARDLRREAARGRPRGSGPGERIAARPLAELGGDPRDRGGSRHQSTASRSVAQPVPLEDAAEREQLADDLPGGEAEALALARRGRSRASREPSSSPSASTSDGERAELAQPAEPVERGAAPKRRASSRSRRELPGSGFRLPSQP